MGETNLKHRYWVFGIDQYYPVGGLDDVRFTSDSIEQAINYAKKDNSDCVYIFDSVEKRGVDGWFEEDDE